MKTSASSFFAHKILALLCAAILPALLATSVHAQAIAFTNATYTFGTSGNVASFAYNGAVISNLVPGNLIKSAGLTSSSSSGNFRATGWTTNDSLDTADYIGFTVSAASGSTISLSNFNFGIGRSASGTKAWAWYFSTNGFTNSAILTNYTTLAAGLTNTAGVLSHADSDRGWTNNVLDLSGLSSLTNVEFRLYSWSSDLSTGSAGLQGPFAFSGSVINATGPIINSFSPASGFVGGTVTINGFNFGATPAVKFNGIAAASSVNVGGTVITATVPSGATTGKITVEVAGQDTATSATDFTVLDPNTPIITLSTNTISGLSTSIGVASAVTNYSVTGTNLGVTPITVTPSSTVLEIGTNGTDFTNVLSLPSVGGVLSNNVFVRVAAANVVTNYTSFISHVSGSASNSLTVSGAVTNIPAVLAVSTNALSGFVTTINAASAAQTFIVTGSNLSTNVTVSAPAGFEVASDGVNFGANAAITPASGIVANAEVSVRLAAGVVSGPRSGNVTVASTGAAQRTVAVNGSVAVPNIPGLVYWNFDAATPTSGTGGDYATWVFPAITQNNNNGTTVLLDSTAPSAGYTNPFNVTASGTTNAGTAARIGSLNTNAGGSAFFEVRIVVPSSTSTSITNISFGSRGTSTGPTAYAVRSSADNFATDVVTNSLVANSAWAMYSAPIAVALSNGTNTIRIYGYGGAGSPGANTANWRIDDLTLALGTGTGPNPPSGLSYTPSSVNGVVGAAITSMVPTVTGTVTNYSISPTLPSGLSINPTTGVIGGTPTIPAAPAAYTVTAINSSGSTSAAVNITILSVYQAGYTTWLAEFQLDPLVTTGPTAGAPNADPDSDGFSNASEYAFGTNPKVPNGALLTTTTSNSIFRSSWPGPASGVTYGVQISTNLSTMAFSNDPTISIESLGGIMSFTNQATGNKFFRVRATSN